MDRVFLAAARRDGDRFVVTGPERRHLADALRVREGETFLATDGEGREYLLEAETVAKRELVALVRDVRSAAPEPCRGLVLAIAPPKGTRMETAIEKSTELGVARIVPLRTERSVVRSRADSERGQRWRRVARQAAAQSGRSWAPDVLEPATLAEVLSAAAGSGRVLLAHPAPGASPLTVALAGAGPGDAVTILVGPEGGFTDAEVDEGRRAGALAVSLGPTRLRTETAGIVAVALAAAALAAAG